MPLDLARVGSFDPSPSPRFQTLESASQIATLKSDIQQVQGKLEAVMRTLSGVCGRVRTAGSLLFLVSSGSFPFVFMNRTFFLQVAAANSRICPLCSRVRM